MKLPNSNNSPKFLSNANPVTKKIQLKIQQESLNVAQPKRKHPQLGNNHRFKLCPTLKLYSSLSRNNQATKQASTPPHRHHNNKEPNHRNNCPANQRNSSPNLTSLVGCHRIPATFLFRASRGHRQHLNNELLRAKTVSATPHRVIGLPLKSKLRFKPNVLRQPHTDQQAAVNKRTLPRNKVIEKPRPKSPTLTNQLNSR